MPTPCHGAGSTNLDPHALIHPLSHAIAYRAAGSCSRTGPLLPRNTIGRSLGVRAALANVVEPASIRAALSHAAEKPSEQP